MNWVLIATLLTVATTACTEQARNTAAVSQGPAQQDWSLWHAGKRDVERAMDAAIDEPGGGNWAKAVQILRGSNWPPAVKDHQAGMMIIQSYGIASARRPAETLQQGLELVESSSVQPGETREYAPQHLRILFERGAGTAPNAIPIDKAVADCWLAIERRTANEPARCIALRRQRLPRVGT
jgi:hypothetical protein